MVSSMWQYFSVSQGNERFAKCKTCGAKFPRSGKKRRSFYMSSMISHLRCCKRKDDVWKEFQGAKLLKRKTKRVRREEEETQENDEEQPGPSTILYKEQQHGLWTVTCGDKTGLLDVSKLMRSTECIKCEGQWFLPNAFEEFGGRALSRKWKTSIFYQNKPLQYWFKKGYLFTKGFQKRYLDCLKETTNLPPASIPELLSDSSPSTTATVGVPPAGAAEEPVSADVEADDIAIGTHDRVQESEADSWCQPLDPDVLIEEDPLLPDNPSSPAAKRLCCSPAPEVAGEVELAHSPDREDKEPGDIQTKDETISDPSSPATTVPDVTDAIATETPEDTREGNESTDTKQETPQKWTARGFPESPTASLPTPSAICDLDAMDLDQLNREKLKMEIKVLRLQEEYYTRRLGRPLT